MKAVSIFLVPFFLIISVITLFSSKNSYASAVDRDCTKVESIFARGSGQDLDGEDSEKRRFFSQIGNRLKNSSLTNTEYELGTEKYGDYQYPAVAVNNWSFANAIGASLSSGYYFTYGNSVKQGVGELQTYITQRYNRCKSTGTQYILGGYSQGAQVIGQTLPSLSREIRDKIVYIGLFADPKLHLPEGEGWNPPACRGEGYSPWRRTVSTCDLDNGSLGARIPYLPDDMKNKAGLWCYAYDMVCDVGALGDASGHGEYKSEGRAIDEAALEAVTKLSNTQPVDIAKSIDLSIPKGHKTTGADTVFVIDTTGSMHRMIDQAVNFARNSAERIKAQNGRVALVGYKDLGDEYTAKIFSGFDDSYDTFVSQLESLSASGGGDTPEATLHALMTAMNGLSWRNGATKAIIILSDTDFHPIDPVDGSTVETVMKRSLEIDPVNVYPVIPDNIAPWYTSLAESTSGQIIPQSVDIETSLSNTLKKIQERPVPFLKNLEYKAEPGQEITFDASDSYVIDAKITSYDWDFNGDGVFEATTTTPSIKHVYPSVFSGTMQVRLAADNDTIANASAVVVVEEQTVRALPSAPKNLSASVVSTYNNKSIIRVSWAADSSVDSWRATIDDMPLGTVNGDRTSFELTDFDRSQDTKIYIAGVNTNGTGASASVTIKAIESGEPSAPVLSTCTHSNIFLRLLCKALSFFKLIIQGITYFVIPRAM